MLRWALAFLIIALGAAAFGFGGATGLYGTLPAQSFICFCSCLSTPWRGVWPDARTADKKAPRPDIGRGASNTGAIVKPDQTGDLSVSVLEKNIA